MPLKNLAKGKRDLKNREGELMSVTMGVHLAETIVTALETMDVHLNVNFWSDLGKNLPSQVFLKRNTISSIKKEKLESSASKTTGPFHRRERNSSVSWTTNQRSNEKISSTASLNTETIFTV